MYASRHVRGARKICDEVVAQLSGRIREWCHSRGVNPHQSLDIVASLALAMAASGVTVGPTFYQELERRAQASDTPEGLIGLAEAARQVIAYLADTAPPLGP
jgi:hypothetical protein